MTQGKKIPFKMRHPDEFREAAEEMLSKNHAQRRADEELARNPDPGQVMKDGTVFAGIELVTGRKIFAAPQDESIRLDFNEAVQRAGEANAQKYLGHDDWEIPSSSVLKVLYKNCQKGALAGTFETSLAAPSGRTAFYWSSDVSTGVAAPGVWFDDGTTGFDAENIENSVRLVRLSGEGPP